MPGNRGASRIKHEHTHTYAQITYICWGFFALIFRAAKRHMDEKSFYGGVLHVCYVPEYETVEDTRLKLQDRRGYIMRAFCKKGMILTQYAKVIKAPTVFLCVYFQLTSSEYFCDLARERAKTEVSDMDPPPSSDPVGTSQGETVQNKTLHNDNTGTFNNSHYSAFPSLPLPPREYRTHGDKTRYSDVPTEDKMGTLHNVIMDTKQQLESSPSSSQMSLPADRGTERPVTTKQSAAVRFVPRTTHLESRKRRMQENGEQSDTDAANEPLIGPRLPETPKLDMEDESLNTTVNLIRNTLKKVRCFVIMFM